MKRNLFTLTAIIVVSLATTFLANYFILAWTAPDANPPGGTVPSMPGDQNASTICNGTNVYLDGDGNCDTVVDTNTNTICTGTNVYLDGDGNCDTVIDTNTNAETICNGTNVYLDGDGGCDTVIDTNTNAETICNGTNVYLDGDGNCDTLTTGWPAGSYCILQNGGSCPGGFTGSTMSVAIFSSCTDMCDGNYTAGDSTCTLYGGGCVSQQLDMLICCK